MTAREKMYKNIEKWRGLPRVKQRSIMRASNVKHVVSSMAMEGEPVSRTWLRKNAR